MYHNFLIHSSVDEHLGCFYVPAIVSSDAMNIVFFFFFILIILSVKFSSINYIHSSGSVLVGSLGPGAHKICLSHPSVSGEYGV